MPLIHERAFRVRHYECDAYQRLHPSVYLRYMQESAMDASAAAGYDHARYASMGMHWLIRETDIRYLGDVTADDQLIVKTWVADFRRVRSRRAYELRLAASGEIVAAAHTDWVFLDSDTLRPATVPEEMILAFYPEGVPQQAPRRTRLPDSTPPPDPLMMTRPVAWGDIDPAQHVNNARYLDYVEDCSAAQLVRRWRGQESGEAAVSLVTRRCRIEYKLPALMGDVLHLTSWLTPLSESGAAHHCHIKRGSDKQLLARAYAEQALVSPATGQELPFPAGADVG